MKKRIFILVALIILMLIAIFSAIIYKPPQYTSYVIKSYPKQVQFYFFDENNCSLNGYVFNGNKLIGKTEKGVFNLSYKYYSEEYDVEDDVTLFGRLGNCSNESLLFDKSWESFEIPDYYFNGESIFRFKTSLNPHNPTRRELTGFIQPYKVQSQLKNIRLKGEVLEDLSAINNYLNKKIVYADDWDFNKQENYWQLPEETLKIGKGDCEDYSTALLSLFLAYNSSLNCYNIIFSSHVSTFCYIGDYYIYYDQQKTELRKRIPAKNRDTIQKLSDLKEEYLKYYGIENDTKVHYAFNEYRFIEFENDYEFISWQYAISNKKKEIDLFRELEKEASGINFTVEEAKEEVVELTNLQPELPSLKGFVSEYSTLLIIFGLIFLLLIILLVWVNLKK